jgi:hypothetical protein
MSNRENKPIVISGLERFLELKKMAKDKEKEDLEVLFSFLYF